MEQEIFYVHIATENALVANGLRHHLQSQFGSKVILSCSYDLKGCLRNVQTRTHILVLDDSIDGVNGEELRRKIRAINPQVQLVRHTSHNEVSGTIRNLISTEYIPVMHHDFRKAVA